MAKALIGFELPAFLLLAFVVPHTVKTPRCLSELIMKLKVISHSYKPKICVFVCLYVCIHGLHIFVYAYIPKCTHVYAYIHIILAEYTEHNYKFTYYACNMCNSIYRKHAQSHYPVITSTLNLLDIKNKTMWCLGNTKAEIPTPFPVVYIT